jgi:hypothetical protein
MALPWLSPEAVACAKSIIGRANVTNVPHIRLEAACVAIAFKAIDMVDGTGVCCSDIYRAYGIHGNVIQLELRILRAIDWKVPMPVGDCDDSVYVVV